jgi:hypothetical protein
MHREIVGRAKQVYTDHSPTLKCCLFQVNIDILFKMREKLKTFIKQNYNILWNHKDHLSLLLRMQESFAKQELHSSA